MVSGIAGELSTKLVFTLANGATFSFNTLDTINENNYLTSIKLDERLSENSNIPIGVNSGNVLDIEGISKNHALIPDNENSIYYGYMNKTATIDLYITEIATQTEYYFGKFYVDTWKSSITGTVADKFIISAVNLMGTVSKCDVPDVSIYSGMKIKDYVQNVIVSLNAQLPQNKQISIDPNDIDFSEFPTMYFCNIDTTNIDNCFNNISFATLTNIFIDRLGNIKTDYALDDTEQQATYNLDILTSAALGTGSLVSYDGIKVCYTLGNIKDIESIASVSDYTITPSDNEINDISLGDSVYKVNRVEITPKVDDKFIAISRLNYNKNKLSIKLTTDENVKVDVTVYGQRLDNTELYKEVGGENKLEVTNRIITSNLIKKYINNINKLMNIKNNSMQVEAYIKPDIKLADIIYINADGAMSISGYYKIVGLSWNLGMYGKCTLDLIKTFVDDTISVEDISDALSNSINLLHTSATTYSNVDPTSIVDISEATNELYMQNSEVYVATVELESLLMEG